METGSLSPVIFLSANIPFRMHFICSGLSRTDLQWILKTENNNLHFAFDHHKINFEMKNFTSLVLAIATVYTLNAQTTWSLDKSHTSVGFVTTHMTISEVEGEFQEFDGTVVSNGEDFAGSTVEFTAQVGSITTNNDRRDGHLKSDDFFNAEMYPELKFSGNIIKEGDDHFLVGDLTIRDVTKPIKFDVKYGGQVPGRNGQKAGFKVTGTIDRFEYGLKWNAAMEAGGLMVGKDVEIVCRIELNEQAS